MASYERRIVRTGEEYEESDEKRNKQEEQSSLGGLLYKMTPVGASE